MDVEPFVGEIAVTAFSFAPPGWAFCNGAVIAIRQNTTLFSLLGIQYGGDGRTTFQLPNLVGRIPIGAGQGQGLSRYEVGDKTGQSTVALSYAEMPRHGHDLRAATTATTPTAAGSILAPTPTRGFRPSGGSFTLATLGPAGGGQPHENRQPYVGLHYLIALQGQFPSFG